MAITLASHGNTGGNTGPPGTYTFTIPITCSAGDVIYVAAYPSMGTGPTLTGETFSTIATLSTFANLYRCVAANAHTSDNITWSYTGNAIAYYASAEAWTGVNGTSNVIGAVGNTSASGSSVTLNCSVTTAAANSLTLGFASCGPFAPTAGTGYTQTENGSSPGGEVFSEHANAATGVSGTMVTVPINYSGFGSIYGVAVSLAPAGLSTPARRRSHALVIQ